jgi:hypothetical protein
LQVCVADSGGGFTQSSGGGTGLKNIRACLTAMYGDAGRQADRNAPWGRRDDRGPVVDDASYRGQFMSALHTLEQPSSPVREALTGHTAARHYTSPDCLDVPARMRAALIPNGSDNQYQICAVHTVGDQIKAFGFLLAIAAADGIQGRIRLAARSICWRFSFLR